MDFYGREKETRRGKKLTEIQSKINNGTFAKKENITLGELFDLWFENHVNLKLEETTKNGYDAIVKKHILPYFKNNNIVQKIAPLDIDVYYNGLLKKGLSPNTVHRHHACLNKVFSFAMKKRLISHNIMEHIDELPKRKKFKSDIYDADQVQLLFEIIKENNMEIPVHLAAALGLRLSEVCGVRWSDFDTKKQTMSINIVRVRNLEGSVVKQPKNETSKRTILLPKELAILLELERDK